MIFLKFEIGDYCIETFRILAQIGCLYTGLLNGKLPITNVQVGVILFNVIVVRLVTSAILLVLPALHNQL
jgi:hypothetical protein